MSLSIGIVGLPNVGKSTLFNALTKSKVDAANYPFCTIDPHHGCISVPDIRLKLLADLSHSEKIIPAMVEFVDIAGLVKGAAQGQGLGNKFLANIRECDALIHILRHFTGTEIIHVENRIDPRSDLEIIKIELILADLQNLENIISNLGKKIKNPTTDKESKQIYEILLKIKTQLENNVMIKDIGLNDEELFLIKSYGFLTQKPCLYVLNVSEADLKKSKDQLINESQLDVSPDQIIPICAQLEAELIDLPENEIKDYLKSIGVEYTGLEQLILAGFKLLNLMTYLTTGEKETRAWTIQKGWTAPQAAGVIHTDFERGFICADVINWQELLQAGGWTEAREKGLVRQEGKDYVMQDGDVVIFKFNV